MQIDMICIQDDHFPDVVDRCDVLGFHIDEQDADFPAAFDRLGHHQMQHDAGVFAAAERATDLLEVVERVRHPLPGSIQHIQVRVVLLESAHQYRSATVRDCAAAMSSGGSPRDWRNRLRYSSASPLAASCSSALSAMNPDRNCRGTRVSWHIAACPNHAIRFMFTFVK